VILHFAYGSNMSRVVMRRHAPNARPVGVAALAGHSFVITADGYASVEPQRASTVYGVLWRLTSRDRATLDAWENVGSGLYRAKMLPVQQAGRRSVALTYVARSRHGGLAKAGYMELVIAAALEWDLPRPYTHALRRWLPQSRGNAGPRKLEEFGWT
jgi:AIG2-like family